MPQINYNERSWAIDVISEINLYLANKSWHVKSAGGENTIRNEKSSLFPDVLIFKDSAKKIILQGWELKMPDTPITDTELINNAKIKSEILNNNSFILWNVTSAVLYVKKGNTYSILKSWDSIDLHSRSEVKENENLWKDLLHTILEDLNDYFEHGEITESGSSEILAIDKIIDIVLENIDSTAENIKENIKSSAVLDAQIDNWWLSSAAEYGFNPQTKKDVKHKLPTLSKVILTDWFFKIIFGNIIKRHFNEAKIIETITFDTTVSEAQQIIAKISKLCNFGNIFGDNIANELISDNVWKQLVQLNLFISNIKIESIDIQILQNLLQSSIDYAKRKVAGQFATPPQLADLLTRITINNKNGITLDPCCGTGTIIKQAYSLKEEYEIGQDQIIESIWASDKYSFPIQLSTLSLSNPNNMGKTLNIFRSDVIDLHMGQTVFEEHNNGNQVEKKLPYVDYVVSNLPFIREKETKKLNPNIGKINELIKEQTKAKNTLSKKSDIFAYIPFYLYNIISNNGRIGLILSNAWLGTDYGEIFLKLIQKYFNIDRVVVSGNGRWFNNAKVVTTLLIATKREISDPVNLDRKISFCTLKEKIENIADIKKLSSEIILNKESEQVNIQSYSISEIKQLENIGIPWSGYFANLNWLPAITEKLLDSKKIFKFIRGERRGCNRMFYPAAGHGIEDEYIKPVLKNLKKAPSFIATSQTQAFCCSKSIEELETLNHTGALNWIRSFENQMDKTNKKPLPVALHRANMFWYEMSTKNMADFVVNINFDKSLFIAMLDKRSFFDQRMIGFSIKEQYKDENKIFLLALLNNILSMFFIESLGFGRGLGALDLSKTKFEKSFKMLNPEVLSDVQKEEIIKAFQPIFNRDRLPLEKELEQKDRIDFELMLLKIYGLEKYYDTIRQALLHLYKTRFAVKEKKHKKV